MDGSEAWLLDAAGLEKVIATMARELFEMRQPERPLRLVGVRTRGYPLARRLAERLEASLGSEVPVGAVEITLYRDDLEHRTSWPVLRGTEVPFPVDGAEIVLVDDVLHTGRTVRAALNAICDLGRPARVLLAAVVDRGGRELPFAADVVGARFPAKPTERIAVRMGPIDPTEGVVRVTASEPS